MSLNHLITVITPTLNSEPFLLDCIHSVKSQKVARHIIVDGGSIDKTKGIALENGVDLFIDAPGSNIYEALNIGIQNCDTEFICFLNSDDLYAGPNTLHDVLDIFSFSSDDTLLLYGDCEFVDGNLQSLYYLNPPKSITYTMLKKHIFLLSHPSTFFRTSLFNKYGLYRTDLSICSDLEFLIRVFSHNIDYVSSDIVFSKFRRHNNNFSNNSYFKDLYFIALIYDFYFNKTLFYIRIFFRNMYNYNYIKFTFKQFFKDLL
jgi:glycosyltransferase involved in cell wall biosynthesis